MSVINELQSLFEDIFLDVPALTAETTADDIEEWDSITNVALIVAIEQKFDFQFATGEVERFRHVGDLADAIEKKTQA